METSSRSGAGRIPSLIEEKVHNGSGHEEFAKQLRCPEASSLHEAIMYLAAWIPSSDAQAKHVPATRGPESSTNPCGRV